MKILMWCDGGCNTGFGTVTHCLATRWSKTHDVHILGINYTGDPWDANYKLYFPKRNNPNDMFGLTRLVELVDKIKPDVMFIMNDLNIILEGLKRFKDGEFPVPTVLYVPIDGDNIPKDLFIPAHKATTTVSYSKFGQRVFKQEANLDTEVIYHGIEHDAFWRMSEEKPIEFNGKTFTNKEELKKQFALDGQFVVFAINRNSIRKNYYDTFYIFNQFVKKHPDAQLLVHAVKQDEGGNLEALVERYGLHKNVLFSDPKEAVFGVSKSLLNVFYNMSDVKISTSMGEGFGLTDAEAIACGIPVIAQDCSATTEVVGSGGVLIKPNRTFTTARMIDFKLPDLDGYIGALEELYQDKSLREFFSDQGVQYAQRFNWDSAAWQFDKVFQRAIKKFESKNKKKVAIKANI